VSILRVWLATTTRTVHFTLKGQSMVLESKVKMVWSQQRAARARWVGHAAPSEPPGSLPDPSPASDPTPSPDPSPAPDPKPQPGPAGPSPVPGVIPPRPPAAGNVRGEREPGVRRGFFFFAA
jgi:hypothetical protein